MFNPEIISKFGEFETEEGCLSLDGERKAVRYKTIKVKYFNENFKQIKRSFSDFTAQIIQHEIDHCKKQLLKEMHPFRRLNVRHYRMRFLLALGDSFMKKYCIDRKK